jgi:two-component system, response regulator
MTDKTIVLVEDNPDDEMLTLRAFRQNELKNPVVVLRDGAEAVQYLKGEGVFAAGGMTELPGIILLDLNLPKLNGIEVLKEIRGNPKTEFIPVIVLTTSRQDEDMVKSYRGRANSFLHKPVNFNDFVNVIRQMGVYWLRYNETPHGRMA